MGTDLPKFIRPAADLVYLAVRVQPRARQNEIIGIFGDELKIKIAAPPVDSAANEMLVRYVAERLGCARGAVQLAKGGASRSKRVAVRGVPAETILERLRSGGSLGS